MQRITRILRSFSSGEKKVFLIAVVAGLISVIALLVSGVSSTTERVPARGGQYIEGDVGQPAFVNPVLAASDVDKTLVALTFARLKNLAEKIEQENDRTWRVRLKENTHWSDGAKLTSDDFLFTIERIQDVSRLSPLYRNWQGVTTERASEREFVLKLNAPYSFFEDTAKDLQPIPKHLFADAPLANWHLSDHLLRPVGSGPYVVESFDQDAQGFIRSYALRANPTYVHGEPFISKFTIRFFKTTDELIAGYNAGGVDGFVALEPSLLQSIKRPYRTTDFTLPNYYAIFINQTSNPVLQDPVVRGAIGDAIDRTALIEAVLDGRGVPTESPLPPGALYASETTSTISTTSLEAVNERLEKNGWRLNGEVREKTVQKAVSRLEFTLQVPEIPFLVRTAAELERSWKQIGVLVQVNRVSLKDITDSVIARRSYELLLFGNVLGDHSDLFSFWHSSERLGPGLNLSLYANKDADALIEKIRTSSDEEERKKLSATLAATIMRDMPAVFLYEAPYTYVSAGMLRGITPLLIGAPEDRFLNVALWHVRTSRDLKQ